MPGNALVPGGTRRRTALSVGGAVVRSLATRAARDAIVYGSRMGMNYIRGRGTVAARPYAQYTYPGKNWSGYTGSRALVVRKPLLGVGRRLRVPAKRRGTISRLAKRVSNISRLLKTSTGTLTFHDRATMRAVASANQMSQVIPYAVRTTEYEGVLAQLRFFDIATPGTLVQASGATGAYSRDYLFKSVYSHCTVSNNYQVPAKVTVYVCCSQEDTDLTPLTAFTNGLADQGNPTSTSMMLHLSDSIQFRKIWRICSSKVFFMKPGVQRSMSWSVKDVRYDPSLVDSHNLLNQTRYKTFQWIVRVEGVISHDTVDTTQQGFSQAGVDIAVHTKYVVEYEAGTDVNFIYVNDSADAMTTASVISEAPVADNISFSVT